MNPYLILGVPREANDKQIRQAYLDAIKASPPDTHPERFQDVSAAYEQIKDEASRHRFLLFNRGTPGDSPMDVFSRWMQLCPPTEPPTFETLKEILRACSKA